MKNKHTRCTFTNVHREKQILISLELEIMKKKICIYPLIIMGVLLMITSSCKKDDVEPDYPMIRLKSGTGLNDGVEIVFLALSDDVNYYDLDTDEKFEYKKTDADWYIDGDVIPFVTDYKEFRLSTEEEYYLLLRASGTVMVTTVTVLPEDQTFIISGSSYGGISFDVEQP